jgi:hypothetical protein
MNKIDLDAFVIRFGNASIEEIKAVLQYHKPEDWETSYLEAWLHHKEEEAKNKPILLYHCRKAPEGKLFKAYEVPALEKKGWVDSPDKFREGIICKIRNLIKRIIKSLWTFWSKHWPILLPIIVAFFGIIVTLFIYLDSKATTKAQQEKNKIKDDTNIIHTTPK